MAQHNNPYQGRPQQQQPSTTLLIGEELKVNSEMQNNEPSKDIEVLEPTESELFSKLSKLEQFKRIVASGLADVITGLVSPMQVKNDLSAWFSCLTYTEQTDMREALKNASLYIKAQVEDVLNEAPALFM